MSSPVLTKPRCLAALLVAAFSGACMQPVGPARTYRDYELKAESTAKSVRSSVETARLGVDVARRDRAFPPYVSVLLSEAETDAANAQGTFEGIQPPDHRADDLRDRLTSMLSDASDALAQLRIAARRADLEALPRLARPLPRLSRGLDRFATEHE